jgi:hypothetical protein
MNSTVQAFIDPLRMVLLDPVVMTAAVLVVGTFAANELRKSKNARAQKVADLIDNGTGLVYKYMVARTASGAASIATMGGLQSLERDAITSATTQIKTLAAAQAVTLPSDAELAIHLAAGLGKAYAADTTVSPLGTAVSNTVSAPGGAAVSVSSPAGGAVAALSEPPATTAQTASPTP